MHVNIIIVRNVGHETVIAAQLILIIIIFYFFLGMPQRGAMPLPCRRHGSGIEDMEASLASVFLQPLARKAWGRCPTVSMREIYSALAEWHPVEFSVWVVSHSPDPLPR